MKLPVIFLTLALSVSAFAAKPTRPNIVFILSDDHATSAIGAYGSKIANTPQLDRLAREGMRFTNCFATNSICTPSRASILTGLYSHATGVTTNYTKLDQDRFTTFPLRLQQAGYQTAIIGKSLQWKQPRGFDHWCTAAGAKYVSPKVNLNGVVKEMEGYVGDVIKDQCLQWLDDRDTSRPFYLACQPSAAHAPFTPDPGDRDLFEEKQFAEPTTFNDDYAGRSAAGSFVKTRINPGMARAIRHWGYDVPSDLEGDQLKRWTYQWYIKNYLRCVKSIDDTVGTLLSYLDDNDLADNTIVVYTSDQGMYLGEHGWFDKRTMYEESIRMPLIVRWPSSVAENSIQPAMTLNVDLPLTLLDVAGVALPDGLHGKSLKPLIQGDAPDDWRQSMYYHYYEYDEAFPWSDIKPHCGVRTERHKLIWFYTSDVWELYDLKRDPSETRNEYENPAYAKTVDQLKRELGLLRDALDDNTGKPILIK